MSNKIRWISQSTGINFSSFEDSMAMLIKMGYDAKDFGVIPFTNKITNLENILEEDLHYIIRGGTKMLSILDDVKNISEVNDFLSDEQIAKSDHYIKRLKAGMFYSDPKKFDQEYYGRHVDLPLLNGDAKYVSISENLYMQYDTDKFIKPSADRKAFTAGIINPGMSIKSFIEASYHNQKYDDGYALIADPKNVLNEYRFFVLGTEIIGMSSYRIDRQFKIDAVVPKRMQDVAFEYAKLYQPDEVFTMDLCDVDGNSEIKIVEYNCFNASGFYSTNLEYLFEKITDHVRFRNV